MGDVSTLVIMVIMMLIEEARVISLSRSMAHGQDGWNIPREAYTVSSDGPIHGFGLEKIDNCKFWDRPVSKSSSLADSCTWDRQNGSSLAQAATIDCGKERKEKSARVPSIITRANVDSAKGCAHSGIKLPIASWLEVAGCATKKMFLRVYRWSLSFGFPGSSQPTSGLLLKLLPLLHPSWRRIRHLPA